MVNNTEMSVEILRQKKKYFPFILLCLIGIWGLTILIHHIYTFANYDNFIIEHPELIAFSGTNFILAIADFNYFTHHTLLVFSLWCVLFGIAKITNARRLECFLRKDTLICFIFTNYLFTTILYTVFQLTSTEITFGLLNTSPLNLHNFATNLCVHYVLFIIAVVVLSKTKTIESNKKTAAVYISIYLSTYYLVTKLLGEFIYPIRWFPYMIIFDARTLGALLGINSYGACVFLLALICLIIFIAYWLVFYCIIKAKRRQSNIHTKITF